MPTPRRARALLALSALVVAPACASSSHRVTTASADGEVAPDRVAVLVTNKNWSAVNVFVVANGKQRRLGRVDALSKESFTFPQSYVPTGQFRIIADPVVGFGLGSSGQLALQQGRTVEFLVAPVISNSSVMIY